MGRSSKSPELVEYHVGVYNLQQLYRKADYMDRSLGSAYYRDFGDRIWAVGRKYGCNVKSTSCAVYAALSPNNSEENNMRDMARAISTFQGSPATLEARWKQLTVLTYGANKAKALRILHGEDPDLVLKGDKTNSFFHNLFNYDDPYVTVDGHMVNAWNNVRVPLDLAGINTAQYRMIAGGVAEAAKPTDLSPSQLQSTLWLTWRRINRILFNGRNLKLDFGE